MMRYISTRDNYEKVSAAEAIKMGMVPLGGLFVPEELAKIPEKDLENFKDLDYQEMAKRILSLFLTDYTEDEISFCVDSAYNEKNFLDEKIAPLKKLNENTYILELWHGPTAAFKDMALQIMPYFLSLAMKKIKGEEEIVILVATSGDTGKAALEGFKDVENTKIIVFYPKDGVSQIQEMQMKTTEGDNTFVVAVEGNFDDCQRTVKEIFADGQYVDLLKKNKYQLSSANSINWGRLLPQIIYYFDSYFQLVKSKEITFGEQINFVVPTGNFGNILAGFYAKKMGLPVARFICASNENKVLADFFLTGTYDRKREFKKTNSPSMDILVSSNLERFLFELTDHDGEKIKKWMEDLNEKGEFSVDEKVLERMKAVFSGGFLNEAETLKVIKKTFEDYNYTLDTHTAVALGVYEEYQNKSKDQRKTIIDSTASPFKFNGSVLEALFSDSTYVQEEKFSNLESLSAKTGLEIHPSLKDLDKKKILHNYESEVKDIPEKIKKILGI